jgi:hypothetical protein
MPHDAQGPCNAVCSLRTLLHTRQLQITFLTSFHPAVLLLLPLLLLLLAAESCRT